jgi:hypothetical protein
MIATAKSGITPALPAVRRSAARLLAKGWVFYLLPVHRFASPPKVRKEAEKKDKDHEAHIEHSHSSAAAAAQSVVNFLIVTKVPPYGTALLYFLGAGGPESEN